MHHVPPDSSVCHNTDSHYSSPARQVCHLALTHTHILTHTHTHIHKHTHTQTDTHTHTHKDSNTDTHTHKQRDIHSHTDTHTHTHTHANSHTHTITVIVSAPSVLRAQFPVSVAPEEVLTQVSSSPCCPLLGTPGTASALFSNMLLLRCK